MALPPGSRIDSTTQIVLASGVPRVWDEGVEEHYVNIPGESYASRILRCAWEDRAAIADYFLNTISTVGPLSFVYGVPYPAAPTLLFSNAVDLVKGQPTDRGITDSGDPDFGKDGIYQYQGMWAARFALLKVGFRAPVIAGADGTISVDYSQDVIAAPGSGIIWRYDSATGADTVPVEDTPPFRFRAKQIRRTRNNLAVIPQSAIDAAIAAPVNSDTVTIDGRTYQPGFLRFEGANSTRQTLGRLGLLYSVEFCFSYRGIEWNKFFDPKTKTWRFIYLSTGDLYYPTSSLGLLLV